MKKVAIILALISLPVAVFAGASSKPYRDGFVKDYLQNTSDTIGNPNASFAGDGSNLTGVGGRLEVLDNQISVGNVSAIDFGDLLSAVSTGSDTVEIQNNATNASAVATDISGCIQNGGFQLAHADIDGDSVVKLEKGGNICLSDPESDYFEQVNMTAGDTLDLDIDLINGTTRNPSQWYEIAVMGDSDGVEPTKLVAYDSTSTPTTQADLETGYELFASLGSVRNAWARTDADSNFWERDYNENRATVTMDELSRRSSDKLVESGAQSNVTSVDVSDWIPPTTVDFEININVRSVHFAIGPTNNITDGNNANGHGSHWFNNLGGNDRIWSNQIMVRNESDQTIFFQATSDGSNSTVWIFHPISFDVD